MTTPPSSTRPPKPKRDLSYIDKPEAHAIVAGATGDQDRPLLSTRKPGALDTASSAGSRFTPSHAEGDRAEGV
jgi:hypothetical protein